MVYLTAVLEYLVAEVFESVPEGQSIITCNDLLNALEEDGEIQQLVQDTRYRQRLEAGEGMWL